MFGAAPRPSRPAQLSRNVNSLGALWDEWLIGLNGNKPAKDFTSRERGANRHKYSKRLHVWRCISRHVGAGFSAEVVIDRIHQCFGYNLSVTRIIKAFQDANREYGPDGHPNLRV